MIELKTWELFLLIILFILGGIGIGVSVDQAIVHDNTYIAPTYALDYSGCAKLQDGTLLCSIDNKVFNDFWQEATKNTTFTIDGKPVEITDVQVFYKKGWYSHDSVNTLYGNITYYPSGIENSQTYVAPTPIICPTPSSSCPSRSCYDIITAPPCYVAPTPTIKPCVVQIIDKSIMRIPCPAPAPTPTPCAWSTERTSYSFCGKVTVNSSDEFDRLLKDIEKHSYHIQMGWMHLDYEYAHKAYDNTLPAPVNICMGIIPSDNFPIGSEWEGRMAYVIDECASLGSCDFGTLTLIPTPTPTPVFAFPYEFCGNSCLICTDHLGNCTYIPGRTELTLTPTPSKVNE